jgi:hypothetical protein
MVGHSGLKDQIEVKLPETRSVTLECRAGNGLAIKKFSDWIFKAVKITSNMSKKKKRSCGESHFPVQCSFQSDRGSVSGDQTTKKAIDSVIGNTGDSRGQTLGRGSGFAEVSFGEQ